MTVYTISGTLEMKLTKKELLKFGDMYESIANFNDAQQQQNIELSGIELALLYIAQSSPEDVLEKIVGINFMDPYNIIGLLKHYTYSYGKCHVNYLKTYDESTAKKICDYNRCIFGNNVYHNSENEIKFLLLHEAEKKLTINISSQFKTNDGMIQLLILLNMNNLYLSAYYLALCNKNINDIIWASTHYHNPITQKTLLFLNFSPKIILNIVWSDSPKYTQTINTPDNDYVVISLSFENLNALIKEYPNLEITDCKLYIGKTNVVDLLGNIECKKKFKYMNIIESFKPLETYLPKTDKEVTIMVNTYGNEYIEFLYEKINELKIDILPIVIHKYIEHYDLDKMQIEQIIKIMYSAFNSNHEIIGKICEKKPILAFQMVYYIYKENLKYDLKQLLLLFSVENINKFIENNYILWPYDNMLLTLLMLFYCYKNCFVNDGTLTKVCISNLVYVAQQINCPSLLHDFDKELELFAGTTNFAYLYEFINMCNYIPKNYCSILCNVMPEITDIILNYFTDKYVTQSMDLSHFCGENSVNVYNKLINKIHNETIKNDFNKYILVKAHNDIREYVLDTAQNIVINLETNFAIINVINSDTCEYRDDIIMKYMTRLNVNIHIIRN